MMDLKKYSEESWLKSVKFPACVPINSSLMHILATRKISGGVIAIPVGVKVQLIAGSIEVP